MIKWYKTYDIYVNCTRKRRMYSKKKAIDTAQLEAFNLFGGLSHVEVVDVETGEVIFNCGPLK